MPNPQHPPGHPQEPVKPARSVDPEDKPKERASKGKDEPKDELQQAAEMKAELEQQIKDLEAKREELAKEVAEKEKDSLEAKRKEHDRVTENLRRAQATRDYLNRTQQVPGGQTKEEILKALTPAQLESLRRAKEVEILKDTCSIQDVDAEIARRKLTKLPNEIH